MTVVPRGGGHTGSQTLDRGPGSQGDGSQEPSTSHESEHESTDNFHIEDIEESLSNMAIDDGTQGESDFDHKGEPVFPHAKLASLDEMVNRPKWVIPVLPEGELEALLEASIDLAKKGLDVKSAACQRFIKDGLTISFNKIFLDDAVNTWKFDIHKCILKNAEKLIELCVIKLDQDWFPLLELMAIALNPNSRFHLYNIARPSERHGNPPGEDTILYARTPDQHQPKGWLVDLVNHFGELGGFEKLKKRICEGGNLNVPLVCAHMRPFGLCSEVLTAITIKDYMMPIVYVIKKFLEGLTDDMLKKESKQESKNEGISTVFKSLKYLLARLPDQEDLCRDLEKLRLQVILRLLQVSSFNGKMNALNEINRVISNVSYYSHHRHGVEDNEFLTMEMVAKWLQENNVLSVVLKDNLHQPQYVEKLEKIIRFAIKVRTLTLEDLNAIWDAQIGKHEAIVKNVHDLLAKLAWDFSAEQLDHLFSRFQASWNGANKKQQEKLLELIRRLAEDDKEGVIAHKVLGLLWQLAHSDDLPTDIMDQALVAHIKILDYSCSQTQDRDNLKIRWIQHCVEELRQGKWVIPALKQIKAICELFYEQGYSQMANSHVLFRNNVIESIQNRHGVVNVVAENLSKYMNKIREMYKANPSIDPSSLSVDNRYSHIQQIHERLCFLRFVLNDGKMWLCEPQAKQIWVCLAVNCVFPCDRDVCFQWFSEVMGEDPDLDPEICKQFFEENVLTTDPAILNEHGIICFERFFKFVNNKEGLLQKRRNGMYVLENMRLIGLPYLWNVILNASDAIAHKGIEIFKEIFTNLGSQMRLKQSEIHNYLINSCVDRLSPSYQTLSAHKDDIDNVSAVRDAARKIVLCLKTLKEYTAESDNLYSDERVFLPHERACRGRHVTLYVRYQPQTRQAEEFEVWSHTNDSLAAVRRHIHSRVKVTPPGAKLDLYCNGELLNQSDDKRLLGQIPLKERTILIVKLGAVEGSSPSSPDSSSDSSPPMTPQPGEGSNLEAEENLPGVIMSKRNFVSYLFSLGDQGISCQIPELRDICLSLLKLIPSDRDTIAKIRRLCQERALKGSECGMELDSLFFMPSPMLSLYHLEVTYSLLMPAIQPGGESASSFQRDFIMAGGISAVLNMLTKSTFIEKGDSLLKRSAYQVLFKISKFLLTVIGYAQVSVIAEALQKDSGKEFGVTPGQRSAAIVLQQALQHLPNPHVEVVLRGSASKLGPALGSQATAFVPDLEVVRQIQKIVRTAALGSMELLNGQSNHTLASFEQVSKQADFEDIILAKEALESLTLAIALCPSTMDALLKDKTWQSFIINLVLVCKSRDIRLAAADQFYLIATKCCNGDRPLVFFIQLLLTVRMSKVVEYASASSEYFGLLCRLLNFGRTSETNMANLSAILDQEITWLIDVQNKAMNAADGMEVVDLGLLEGHLRVIRELLFYQSLQKKYQIGSEPGGVSLVQNLMDHFIFSASRLVLEARSGGSIFGRHVNPICNTPSTMVAGLDLLVALCTGCVQNLRLLADFLTELYYSGADLSLTEWEFQPPVGPRPVKGFVGLKNAGATCYMNSVLQQLYMIPEVKTGILEVDVTSDNDDDRAIFDDKAPLEIPYNQSLDTENQEKDGKDTEKQYHLRVLRQVQGIFGHLTESKLQFHVPEGFWKSFRLWGEPVNLREQHDALEFFNTLVDNLDEGLKVLGRKSVLSKVLGGSFADQKICKECPHRYSRETPFTSLNVDVRNHHNLIDSLEQYVKGDLLEGANAYYCEKCDKKVDTVKRMCIKKLPKVLAIQLKRFDYDWERDCAVKFNDYFEFPRKFNMEPFTVEGLARMEGQTIEDGPCTDRTNQKDKAEEDDYKKPGSTSYKLVGVVVHSGQASGGHYYSYIVPRPSVEDSATKWYKFDDGEVSECSMDDDEDMKNQCFGGEYTGEVFDHMLKRMSYRRQKRWWNAYILFYERLDIADKKERTDPTLGVEIDMPDIIEQSVRKQNIEFLHNRTQFSSEYFQFMKKLAFANSINFQNIPKPTLPRISQGEREELGLINLKLLCKFLFTVGFHTKKHIRGPANEWADVITALVRQSSVLRKWFVCEVLLYRPNRVVEYLFDCPVGEIRSAFAKVLVFLANITRQDDPWVPEASRPLESWQMTGLSTQYSTLSDYLLKTVLELIHRDSPDTSRHLLQFFQLFVMYAGIGVPERKQLLDLGVLQTFIRLAIEDDRGTAGKYQLAELAKLYSLVSVLIRSCDVTKSMTSAVEGQPPKPNPYYDSIVQQPLMPIPEDVEGLIYTSNYVKKLLEESASSEETIHLLKFLSWECVSFSLIALSEVLFQISYSYSYELRPFLDILLYLLLMDDSWQQQRLGHAFRGVSDDREGLFDTIQRSKAHSQKRGYQCIKAIVQLLKNCDVAYRMIMSDEDLKLQWKSAVAWLGDELERRTPSAYSYNNWSPPTQSNESSNGYFLERSHSARLTYDKACDFFEEDQEEQDIDGDEPQQDTPPEEKTVFFPGHIDRGEPLSEMPARGRHSSEMMEERSPADGQIQKEDSE